jgi:hypothetical protein
MDCVLESMRANGIEINRQNYLDLADLGDVPELDGEVESMLPRYSSFLLSASLDSFK